MLAEVVKNKPFDMSRMSVIEAVDAPEVESFFSEIRQGLDEKGVVLLRGFNPDLHKFEEISRGVCNKFHNAGTRYNARQTSGDSFSTTAFKMNCVLFAHSEGVYAPQEDGRPDVAFFMCTVPPSEKGGETTVIDGAAFLENLPPEWKERFATGIIYEKQMEKERWQGEFRLNTIEELQIFLNRFPNVEYKIHGDLLHMFHKTEAITKSRSGDYVFAPGMLNHLPNITHPLYVNQTFMSKSTNGIYFGDGEVVSDEIVNGLIDIQDAIQYKHVWQKGEVLILDNTRYMHGRTMTVRDCERVLITRFGWIES